ncbi:MAG: GntG family PLP-dependent aldolase [Planctomycetota bacterium]
MIDLRSDTVTKPCEEMRKAMAWADVDDDVIDVDPTVRRLEEFAAELLGKEDAMFMPSGTMTNQIAVRLHCGRGDELICEAGCHIYNYEQGGFSQLSQVIAQTVSPPGKIIHLEHIRHLIRPDDEHTVETRLVCLENTHNKGGGRVHPIESIAEIATWARKNNLKMHLDGARLFNAVVATGIEASEWAAHFDTVSICLSKGLGAPVGSVLACNKEDMRMMRRHRKLYGGGMRQAGIIAAGGLFALENNIERLADDHTCATIIADAVREADGLTLEPEVVDTNIVIFRVDPEISTAEEFCAAALEAGVWMFPFSAEHVRAVTHLHISSEDAEQAGRIISQVAEATKAA